MKTEKTLKTLGLVVSIAGAALNIASGMIEDKKMSERIAKEVSKQLNRR